MKRILDEVFAIMCYGAAVLGAVKAGIIFSRAEVEIPVQLLMMAMIGAALFVAISCTRNVFKSWDKDDEDGEV